MSDHAKRVARWRHRLLVGAAPLLAAEIEHEFEEGKITAEQRVAMLQDIPAEWVQASVQNLPAEIEVARDGQARKNGRPPKPENSNDTVVALLREHRPDDFKGRFTLKRAEATRIWLEGKHKIIRSTDAVTKLINRVKRGRK